VTNSTTKVCVWPYQNRWFIAVGDEERRPVSEEEAIAILPELASKATV
jgi:hypothetical protein